MSRLAIPVCTVKSVIDFPVPSRDVTNQFYQTLPGGEYFSYSWPGRVWLVTSRLGTVKLLTFFYRVIAKLTTLPCHV
jgi:hypothetical protein